MGKTMLDGSKTCEELVNSYLLRLRPLPHLLLLQRQTRLADQTRMRLEVAEAAEAAVDSVEG